MSSATIAYGTLRAFATRTDFFLHLGILMRKYYVTCEKQSYEPAYATVLSILCLLRFIFKFFDVQGT